jgi:hypothetical protein
MNRRRATPFIEKEIAAQTWTLGSSFPHLSHLPKVKIANSVLAGLPHEPETLDTITSSILGGGPSDDEHPEHEIEQEPFKFTPPKGDAVDTFVIFHDGQYWVSERRFFSLA